MDAFINEDNSIDSLVVLNNFLFVFSYRYFHAIQKGNKVHYLIFFF